MGRFKLHCKFFLGTPPSEVTPELRDFSVEKLANVSEFEPPHSPPTVGEAMHGRPTLWLANNFEEIQSVCSDVQELVILFGEGHFSIPIGKDWSDKQVHLHGLEYNLGLTVLQPTTESPNPESWTLAGLEARNVIFAGNLKLAVSQGVELELCNFQGPICFQSAKSLLFKNCVALNRITLQGVGSVLWSECRFFSSSLDLTSAGSCLMERCIGDGFRFFSYNLKFAVFSANTFSSRTCTFAFRGPTRGYLLGNRFTTELHGVSVRYGEISDQHLRKINTYLEKNSSPLVDLRDTSDLQEFNSTVSHLIFRANPPADSLAILDILDVPMIWVDSGATVLIGDNPTKWLAERVWIHMEGTLLELEESVKMLELMQKPKRKPKIQYLNGKINSRTITKASKTMEDLFEVEYVPEPEGSVHVYAR